MTVKILNRSGELLAEYDVKNISDANPTHYLNGKILQMIIFPAWTVRPWGFGEKTKS